MPADFRLTTRLVFAGTAVPSDAYEWYARNGSIDDTKVFCAADTRCAGFYPYMLVAGINKTGF